MNEQKLDRNEVKRRRKVLHDVLDDDVVVQALIESLGDPAARAQLKSDPKGQLERKGGRIPAEVQVESVEDGTSSGIRLVIKGKNASSGVELKVEGGKALDTSPAARAKHKRLNDEISRAIASDATLDALDQSGNDRGAAKKDPKGYLKAKGLDVPDDVEVKFVEKSNPGYCGFFCGFIFGFIYYCQFECRITW